MKKVKIEDLVVQNTSGWAKKFIEPGVKFMDICEDCRWKDQGS